MLGAGSEPLPGAARIAKGEGTPAQLLQEMLAEAAAFALFPKCPRALLESPGKVLEEPCDGTSSCPGWGYREMGIISSSSNLCLFLEEPAWHL